MKRAAARCDLVKCLLGSSDDSVTDGLCSTCGIASCSEQAGEDCQVVVKAAEFGRHVVAGHGDLILVGLWVSVLYGMF